MVGRIDGVGHFRFITGDRKGPASQKPQTGRHGWEYLHLAVARSRARCGLRNSPLPDEQPEACMRLLFIALTASSWSLRARSFVVRPTWSARSAPIATPGGSCGLAEHQHPAEPDRGASKTQLEGWSDASRRFPRRGLMQSPDDVPRQRTESVTPFLRPYATSSAPLRHKAATCGPVAPEFTYLLRLRH